MWEDLEVWHVESRDIRLHSINKVSYTRSRKEDLLVDLECSSRALDVVVAIAVPPLPSALALVLVDSG